MPKGRAARLMAMRKPLAVGAFKATCGSLLCCALLGGELGMPEI